MADHSQHSTWPLNPLHAAPENNPVNSEEEFQPTEVEEPDIDMRLFDLQPGDLEREADR